MKKIKVFMKHKFQVENVKVIYISIQYYEKLFIYYSNT